MGVDISQWRLAVGCHLHRGVTKHRSKNSGKAITRKDVLEEAMNLLRQVPSLIVLILGGLLLVNFSPSSLEYHQAHQFSGEFSLIIQCRNMVIEREKFCCLENIVEVNQCVSRAFQIHLTKP